jgi:hypothetical protein
VRAKIADRLRDFKDFALLKKAGTAMEELKAVELEANRHLHFL